MWRRTPDLDNQGLILLNNNENHYQGQNVCQ